MIEHLNPTVRGLGRSATLAINELANRLRREGRTVYKLGLGQSPFPVPGPVVEALRRHAAEKDYLPVQGLPALCEAVAEFHRRVDGVDANADSVVIGPGSKELLFILQLVFQGDLLIPTPCWVSYVPQAKIVGRAPRLIPVGIDEGWRLGPAHLEAACRELPDAPARLLMLNYPNNPAGNSYPAGELAALASVARDNRIFILADEIYGQLHFEGAHVSIARYYPEGTIIGSGLSKWCGAGGWRLGTFTFPRQLHWLMEAMCAVASETYTAVSAPIQHAAVTAFEGGPEIDDYLAHARRILKALGLRITATLAAAGVHLAPPTGAFYLFLDFNPLRERLAARGVTDAKTLCAQLLRDTGVAVLPGEPFGRPPGELSARLAYVNFDGAAALEASLRVPIGRELPAGFLEERCPETLAGVERLVAWLGES